MLYLHLTFRFHILRLLAVLKIYAHDNLYLEAQWAEPVSLTFHSVLRKLYTEPSIGASYQVWLLDFRGEDFFRNQPIRKKNCLWQPYLLTYRVEMNNLYRGPYINASYQISVHLAMQFQRRRCFRNRPIRNKNCL
jgi:hypothetical protein